MLIVVLGFSRVFANISCFLFSRDLRDIIDPSCCESLELIVPKVLEFFIVISSASDCHS